MSDPHGFPPQPGEFAPQPGGVSSQPPGAAASPAVAAARAQTRSPLSDGDWHRLHPLTPLFRGGVALIVVVGVIIANLRDRLVAIVLPWVAPDVGDVADYDGDPIDFLISNNLIVVGSLIVLGVIVLLVGWFWVTWRFHSFRITDDDVEVRSGVLFRTQRRAPLDRVQGVNLTRPMVARLFGMAKLEVIGAGLDTNVKLEYLTTANAEAVRADILRLASGRRLAEASDPTATAEQRRLAAAAAATVSEGLTGLVDGVDTDTTEPTSVVHIPAGRLVASHLLSGATLWLLGILAAIIIGAVVGTPWLLLGGIPALIAFGAYWFGQITRNLRYSIAPTASGVRMTFGLFTTITEILPPGRAHAFEIAQPLLWRPFGWWRIRINRLSGRAATDTQMQYAAILPVGMRDDVERVMRLFLPSMPDGTWRELVSQGLLGPAADDPYSTTPRRAWLLRPLSWKRNGFLLTRGALLLRSGVLRRALVILPLARLQSVRIDQGPLDRRLDVANITGHTVLGTVSGSLGILDRATTYRLWSDVADAVVAAAAGDRSHRWDAAVDDADESETPDAVGDGDTAVDVSAPEVPGAAVAVTPATAETTPDAAGMPAPVESVAAQPETTPPETGRSAPPAPGQGPLP